MPFRKIQILVDALETQLSKSITQFCQFLRRPLQIFFVQKVASEFGRKIQLFLLSFLPLTLRNYWFWYINRKPELIVFGYPIVDAWVRIWHILLIVGEIFYILFWTLNLSFGENCNCQIKNDSKNIVRGFS